MNDKVEILLVDDNKDDAELTIRALKKKNLANNLLYLRDGEEALQFLFGEGQYLSRDLTDIPKMILLDIKMPKVNGIEVLKRLKLDERTRSIPVIMLTSSRQDPDVAECYRLGANSYIVKPVVFEEFIEAVSELGFYWMLVNFPPPQK